jgi:hypothetical protein
LNGWSGNPDVWRVLDGSIVGEYNSPVGTRNPGTFLVWQGGEPADFELKLEIKLEGPAADSGIQFRASIPPPSQAPEAAPAPPPGATPAERLRHANWNLAGYQFDFNFPGNYNGQLAEAGAGARGVIAYRGQMVRSEPDKKQAVSLFSSLEELGGYFKINDWNQVHLIARGNILIQIINGRTMAIVIDEHPEMFKAKGLIGLQCAGPGSVRISFRNIWLRSL